MQLQGVTAQHVEAARQSNTQWLEDCTIRLLCVLALDRFGDFASDQVTHDSEVSSKFCAGIGKPCHRPTALACRLSLQTLL